MAVGGLLACQSDLWIKVMIGIQVIFDEMVRNYSEAKCDRITQDSSFFHSQNNNEDERGRYSRCLST